MPLDIRAFAQQREYGCLPACVRTVRYYYDDPLTDEEASELCAEYPEAVNPGGGCDWDGALESLTGSYDVEIVATNTDSPDEAWAKLAEWVEERRHPVIVHLRWKGISGGLHAVVVYGVSGTHVEITNPYFDLIRYGIDKVGRRETMGKAEFLSRWQALNFGSFALTTP